MQSDFLKGIVPPLVTPFDTDDHIDEKKLRAQIDYVIDNGVHGILAFGSNGEFYALDEDEYVKGMRIFVDQVRGRVPLFCGIGAISTTKCVRLAKMAFDEGATAVSVLQPMFVKPTEEELYRHFTKIAKAIGDRPMLLYNNPGKAGYPMTQKLVYRLVHDNGNIIGMKDSSGDLTQLEQFVWLNRDVHLKVLGGKDTLIYGALCHGAVGAVTSTANYVPKLVMAIYDRFMAGDYKGSFELQQELNPIRLMTDKASFPVGTKDVAILVGNDVGYAHSPNLLTTDKPLLDAMRKELDRLAQAGLIAYTK